MWDENVWVTTSGMFYLAPFACLVRVVKMERILYSVYYPFERNELGKGCIECCNVARALDHLPWN